MLVHWVLRSFEEVGKFLSSEMTQFWYLSDTDMISISAGLWYLSSPEICLLNWTVLKGMSKSAHQSLKKGSLKKSSLTTVETDWAIFAIFSLHLLRSHCRPVCLTELSRHRGVEWSGGEGCEFWAVSGAGIILTGRARHCSTYVVVCTQTAATHILESSFIYRTFITCRSYLFPHWTCILQSQIINRLNAMFAVPVPGLGTFLTWRQVTMVNSQVFLQMLEQWPVMSQCLRRGNIRELMGK